MNSFVSPRSTLAFFLQCKYKAQTGIMKSPVLWQNSDLAMALKWQMQHKIRRKNTHNISSQVSKLLSRITNSCSAWFMKPYMVVICGNPPSKRQIVLSTTPDLQPIKTNSECQLDCTLHYKGNHFIANRAVDKGDCEAAWTGLTKFYMYMIRHDKSPEAAQPLWHIQLSSIQPGHPIQ